MTKEEFFDELCKGVREEIKESNPDVSVEAKQVVKNNGQIRNALQFMGNANVQPTLYTDGYWNKYSEGEISMEDAVQHAVRTYNDSKMQESLDTTMFTDYDRVKDHVIVVARNAEMNAEQLEDVPHEIVGDLALTYRIEVLDGRDNSFGSTLINNQLMKGYGIDQQTLHEQAWKNTKELHPPKIRSMTEMMREMFADKYGENLPEDLEESLESLEGGPMYVVTNKDSVYGATYMCDPETMSKVAEMVGDNLVILPSSIHECIVLPQRFCDDMDNMKEMVETVNSTEVPNEDILSNSVYTFDAQSQQLSVYNGEAQTQGMTW